MQHINLNRKQKLVYDVIKEHPESANDDAALNYYVWVKEGILNYIEMYGLYTALHKVSRPETLSRRRRELYNLGLITYSKEADQERTEAFINERDSHSDGKAVSWLYDDDDDVKESNS